MTVADFTLAVFTLCNSLRALAYLPRIAKAAADRSGAEAISFSTWGLFLLSHASAVAYALVNRADWTMATMFLANAVGCATILLIGAWKRSQHRKQLSSLNSNFPGHRRTSLTARECADGSPTTQTEDRITASCSSLSFFRGSAPKYG